MDFLVLDTETTALPAEDGEVVEIAILEVRDWIIVDRLHFLVKPNSPMTSKASEANGIKDKDLLRSPKFSEIEPEVTAWLEMGLEIIGYNCSFDREIIEMEYARLGEKFPNTKWIDVYKLVAEKFTLGNVERVTGVRSRSQTNMAKFFGISAVGAHRAMADVEILFKLYRKVIDHDSSNLSLSKNESSIKMSKEFEDKKNKAIESLSKIEIEVISARAVSLAADLSIKVTSKLIGYSGISVVDERTSEEAAAALAWISSFKKDATKARTDALSGIKQITSSVEEMFRDWVTGPLDRAADSLSKGRQSFITRQYQIKIEEAAQKRLEMEKLAEKTAQIAFDSKKKEKGTDAAVLHSDIVYSTLMHDAKSVKAETKTEIRTGTAKVTDTIVFDVEVIDASVVPSKWMTPDIVAIKEYVNSTNGEVAIKGILITPRAESKIRRAK
jgi:DNA polymerase III epsilon subunit family exonuclease